jgi:hypothetical protein
MCTVSWLREPAGYQVFFNRDERRTRAPGLPPALGERSGVRWLAPLDGDQLGTWIGVNQHGLSLGLLNRYEESPLLGSGGPWVSRGRLVASLLDVTDLETLGQRLRDQALDRYQPFSLTVFAPGAPAGILAWDGAELRREQVSTSGLVLTSSGYDQAEAARVRAEIFAASAAAGPWTGERLEELHHSHRPERGPFSICMHRDDAATVSFTRLVVTERAVEIGYVPGPPGETSERIVRVRPRDPGNETR